MCKVWIMNKSSAYFVPYFAWSIMVNSYAAIDCPNHYKAGSGISFHKYPHSKPELLQKGTKQI